MHSDRCSPGARFVRDLVTVLRGRDFRRLFAVRLVAQFGEGAFQAGLAGVFLFSPERQASATQISTAFAVALLPYSLVGPFAGVLLDHWRRQRVLLVANLARAVLMLGIATLVVRGLDGAPLYAAVLVAMSVNRFFLAGLGAGLPHVVDGDELVMANAVSPTTGTLFTLLGAASGYGVRLLIGAGDTGDAGIVLLAAVAYLLAGLLATRLGADLLGPPEQERLPWSGVAAGARAVLHGLAAAGRHLRSRPQAAAALAGTAAHRFAFGITTLATALLCRFRLASADDPSAGLAVLAAVVALMGIGFGVAAVLTPVATQRIRQQGWIVLCLSALGVLQLLLAGVLAAGLLSTPVLALIALGWGVSGQGMKICVDSLLQEHVDDAYRGRAFAVYDVIFNAFFVLAAALAAPFLPRDGFVPGLFGALGAGYLATSLGYRWLISRVSPQPVPA